MKGVSARTYSTNYFLRLTLESWYTNLQQTPLNRCQQVPAPYKRLIQDKTETDKRTSYRRILLIIERSKPTNEDDKLCTSIPANLQRLFIHKKITPARLACLCFTEQDLSVRKAMGIICFSFYVCACIYTFSLPLLYSKSKGMFKIEFFLNIDL